MASRRIVIIAVAGIFLLALIVYAWSGQSTSRTADKAPIRSNQSNGPTATPVTQEGILGGSVRYSDGLVIAASKMTRFTPSKRALGYVTGEVAVAVTVTMTNGGKEVFNPAAASVSLTYGEDGILANALFDPVHKTRPDFGRSLAPGKAVTTRAAFSVPVGQVDFLRLRVTPGDVKHASLLFAGSVELAG